MKENKRFLRNILVGVIALMLVAVIVNIAPGYKRDQYANVVNLIIVDNNVTDKLKKSIIIDNEQNVYISLEDINQFLDNTAYYDEKEQAIIMTSDIKVASMKLDEKKITINGIESIALASVCKIQDSIYVPLDELEEVYNIETNYINNKIIIDLLNENMVSANVSEDVILRYKPRTLSKQVTKLQEGNSVYCFYTSSTGWRLVRTKDGELGYIKANKLANEYVLRQDMELKQDTEYLSISLTDGNIINVNNQNIIIRDIPNLTSTSLENSEYDIWLNVKNDLSEEEMNKLFESYAERTKLINNIVTYVAKAGVKAVNIDMSAIKTNEYFTRFIIELAPRLKDIGILTNVVKTDNLQIELINKSVDYIIEKQ